MIACTCTYMFNYHQHEYFEIILIFIIEHRAQVDTTVSLTKMTLEQKASVFPRADFPELQSLWTTLLETDYQYLEYMNSYRCKSKKCLSSIKSLCQW